MLRLAVDTAGWSPTPEELHALAGAYLPQNEQDDVLRFVQREDQKRALASRLLQRAAIRAVCGAPLVPPSEIKIQRTKGRRPFTLNAPPPHAPNWNFNVSHEGSFTVLVSEPVAAAGVDVCAPTQLRRKPGLTLLQSLEPFKAQFAPEEWSMIRSFSDQEELAGKMFQRLWSLKESYIKARGDGLGFEPLSRARFEFEDGDPWASRARVVVDGKPCPRWCFRLHELPQSHWVSVAQGNPADIVDAQQVFSRTLRLPVPSDDVLAAQHAASPPEFRMLTIQQLLQPEQAMQQAP